MMSANQWLTLWLIFISYLFLGAFIFYAIERRHEEYRRIEENFEKLEIEDLLNNYYTWRSNKAHAQLAHRLKQYCNITIFKPIWFNGEQIIEETEDEFQWTFYNAFFFALTTLSTIGYGNLHPTSCLGRMLVIVYSLVGIPLNGIVLTQLGEFFASTFLKLHQRYKGKRIETRFVLFVDIATYLIPGVLLFIFLPSGFVVYFEGWTFEESIYFAYVTLTTIGYGDYVAGQRTKDKVWYNIYKVVLIFWIMFGLGYLVMILGFISRAMRCKKMARLERKLAQNLKQTNNKIWNEFTRDVIYVRRMMNELYLLKFKPVYQDDNSINMLEQRTRSQSCPNLSTWPVLEKIPKPVIYSSSEDEEETRLEFEKHKMKRRKALSENLFKHSALRIRSENDLTKIDKDATFCNAGNVEQNELLARVVDAFETTYSRSTSTSSLGMLSDHEDKEHNSRKMSRFEKEVNGINIFSNDEILSSEWNKTDWEINRNTDYDEKPAVYSEQWTWPSSDSTAKIPAFCKRNNARFNSVLPEYEDKRQNLQLPGVQSIRRMSIAALNFLSSSRHKIGGIGIAKEDENKDVEKSKDTRTRRSGKVLCARKTSKNRLSSCDIDYDNVCQYVNYFTQTKVQEANLLNLIRNHIGNVEHATNISPILDQCSIGDFLRIVNSLQATSTTVAEDEKSKAQSSPLFTLFQQQNDDKPTESLKIEKLLRRSRRFSLSPPNLNVPSSRLNVSRNKSFSGQKRKLSPSRLQKVRTNSHPALSVPQIRRIRSQSISKKKRENVPDASSSPIGSPPQCRKIKRFTVKPVRVSGTLPQIVVDVCNGNGNGNGNGINSVESSDLQSVRIDKM